QQAAPRGIGRAEQSRQTHFFANKVLRGFYIFVPERNDFDGERVVPIPDIFDWHILGARLQNLVAGDNGEISLIDPDQLDAVKIETPIVFDLDALFRKVALLVSYKEW